MSGVFVIITIPTQSEEKQLRNKPNKKLQFENPIESCSLTRDGKLNIEKKPHTPCAKSVDIQYGTFAELDTPGKLSKRSHSNETVAICIDGVPSIAEKSRTIEKTLLQAENISPTIKKTKSSDNLEGLRSSFLQRKEDLNTLRQSWDGFKDVVSSTTKRSTKKKKEGEEDLDLEIAVDSPMETVLQKIFRRLKIENTTWIKTQNGKSYQITFAIECADRYEDMLKQFLEWGIGDREGSTVMILPCSAFYKPAKDPADDENAADEELNAQKNSAWNRFLNSMRARLNVAQIVEEVKQDATITFDFVILVVVAAILASFGLVEDSTIFLASSMLISPLMGPIIAAIFGTVIKDKKLQKLGVINELIGIFLATFAGFLFGLIVCSIDNRYSIGEGLTTEMLSRCELHSLLVGVLTAIPSGAAVAIAILGENFGSLVGVAISASLLPPAVNAGVLWALACIYMMFEQDGTRYNSVVKTNFYSDHQGTELFILGSISMCVTITNVICIFVMGAILLKIKEVAPITSKSYRQFWKHDIKIARDYNKTCQSEDGLSFTKKLADEFAEMQEHAEHEGLNLNAELFRNVGKASYQNTWSPMSARQQIPKLENRPTIQEMERFYMTMSRPYQEINRFNRASFSGPAKTISRNWSPPELKPLIKENPVFSALSRRASMPFEVLQSPKNHHKIVPMEKIVESQSKEIVGSEPKDKPEGPSFTRKSRKFTVTPASDPRTNKE